MRFVETSLRGAFIVELDEHTDQRGAFTRLFCAEEFQQAQLGFPIVQINQSDNLHAGVVRGMHFQSAPHAEKKIIKCTHGRVFDVIVDVREHSTTRYHWFGIELTAKVPKMLFVPEGFAHGFQVLEPDSTMLYGMSTAYAPDHSVGVRWNDPAFGISWPLDKVTGLSDRDAAWPLISQ